MRSDLLSHLGLHHVASALLQQIFREMPSIMSRVQHVAHGLGHLLAFFVANEAGDVNGLERDCGWPFSSLMKCMVIMIIRAIQKKMMSKPLISTSSGVEGLERLGVVRPA